MGRSKLTEEDLKVARYLMKFLEVRAVLTYDEEDVLEVAINETKNYFKSKFVGEEQRAFFIKELKDKLPELMKLLEIKEGKP